MTQPLTTTPTTTLTGYLEEEVNSWWWNLGTFEIYERMKELMRAGLFGQSVTPEDVGTMLAHAFVVSNMEHTFKDMAVALDGLHLCGEWGAIEDAFDAYLEHEGSNDALQKIWSQRRGDLTDVQNNPQHEGSE